MTSRRLGGILCTKEVGLGGGNSEKPQAVGVPFLWLHIILPGKGCSLLMCGVIAALPPLQTSLICQLQSGDSFGENVVFEDTRLVPCSPLPLGPSLPIHPPPIQQTDDGCD